MRDLLRLPAVLLLGCGAPDGEQATVPPLLCGPGERAAETVCEPVGVPPEACADGFESDGRGGCLAILPTEACAPGELALPGETSCRPVASCAEGTWGDIPIESSTQHVDAAYAGSDSDGSALRPWSRIQDAVDAAASGAIVAVAAGSYHEDVIVDEKPVRLWGRCPSLVEIVATGARPVALTIVFAGSGSTVRSLAITGDAMGIAASAADFTVDRVWLHDLGNRAIYPNADFAAAHATITDTLVEGAVHLGIFVKGYAATIERVVVRGTQPIPTTLGEGRGINVEDHVEAGVRSNVTVRGSLVEQNRTLGIFFAGSDGLVEATLVRDTLPRLSDGTNGRGIGIEDNVASLQRSQVTVRGAVVERNHDLGIFVGGSDAIVESTTVRDSIPRASTGSFGGGISAERAHDTFARSTLKLQRSAIEGGHEVGVLVFDSDAEIEESAIAGVMARAVEGIYGDGLSVVAETEFANAVVRNTRIESSARVGAGSFGARISLDSSLIGCNAIDLTGEPYTMGSFSFEDGGDNACGCPPGPTCKLVTNDLAPPEQLQ